MPTHPYLRAYLSGIFVPTLILPLGLTAFIVLRAVLQVPVPIERGLVFPLALVPIIWGLWNVLWRVSVLRTHLSVGVHGAILPFLLLPSGAVIAHCSGVVAFGDTSVTWFHAVQFPYALIAAGFCCGVAAYYLVWKYIVGFLNRTLGIA
ncbi:MAG: hypothetical protein ABSF23_05660 [Terracidiphilus sp.]|jgi:hypothetical protein